jgi:branched-chain amino acid transport system substrate-binding protein
VPFTFEYIKAEGLTKIGLITDTGGFGADGKAVIEKMAPDLGVKIVADETFNPGDTDMTTQLTKIKNSDAQAIVMWTAGAEAATIAKNVQDLGIDLPLFGSHGIARKEFIEGAGDAAEGVRFAAGKVLIPSAYGEGTEAYTVATDFIDRYTAAYGDAPSTFAGHAFDALYLVVEAGKRIDGDITPEALRDEIEATSGFIGIGGTFTFSPDDHNGMTTDDLVMYEISGGEWTLID